MKPTNEVAKQGVCPDCGAPAIRAGTSMVGDNEATFALECSDRTCGLSFTETYTMILSHQEGVHGTGWRVLPTVRTPLATTTATEVQAMQREVESDFKKTHGLPTIDRLEAVEEYFTKEIQLRCGALYTTIAETDKKLNQRIDDIDRDLDSRVDSHSKRLDTLEWSQGPK